MHTRTQAYPYLLTTLYGVLFPGADIFKGPFMSEEEVLKRIDEIPDKGTANWRVYEVLSSGEIVQRKIELKRSIV